MQEMQISRFDIEKSEDHCPTGLISVLFNLTHQCNLACKYCIMAMPELKQGYQESQATMNVDLVRETVDYIYRAGLPGMNVTFYGGEPLLKFDLLQEAVEYAEQKYPGFFVYNVITNATLLTAKMAAFFQKHRVRFLFSVDGDKAANDRLRVFKNSDDSVYDRAWGNIQQLLGQLPELEYKVNVTYFRPTLDLERAFVSLLAQGVPETRFERGLAPANSPYFVRQEDVERIKEAFSAIAEQYLEHLIAGGSHVVDNFVVLLRKISRQTPRLRGCNMGIDYVTIAADGRVYPCHKLVGHEDFCMGDVRSGTNNERYREFWQHSVVQRDSCSACEVRFLCGGFCICDNYFHNHDFFAPTRENCAIIKHNIKLALRLFTELEQRAPLALKRLLGADYLLETEVPVMSQFLQRPDERMVRQMETGGEYELNLTAVYILNQCDGKKTVGMIADNLAEAGNISKELVLADVRQQLGIFQSAQLISFAD